MTLKALNSFSGAFTMAIGEVATCPNDEVATDLINAGLAVEVKAEEPQPKKKTAKRVKNNED